MPLSFSPPVGALALFGLLSGGAFQAAGQPSEKPVEVADCLRLIRADSAHVFFDSNYALTPQACAYFRRECRMDAATGNFVGQARDYRQLTNKLIRKISYANGQRNGPYEEYYPNQQLAVRGQFADGSPSGTWSFWYKDGQPHQTLEWTGRAQPRLRVLEFWDATGQQQVTNGEGSWQGKTEGYFPTRFGGPVVNGYQQGEWESRDARTHEVRTIEEFNRGRLQHGQQVVAQSLGAVGQQQAAQLMKYTAHPSLEIQVMTDASLQAEPLHLGLNCEQQVRAREADEAIAAMLREGGRGIQVPLPGPAPGPYQRALLQVLSQNAALKQWLPQREGDKTIIKADVDERGQLHNIVSADKALTATITPILTDLGSWKPASVNGRPMPGRMEIELRRERGQLQSKLKTNLATATMMGSFFDSK